MSACPDIFQLRDATAHLADCETCRTLAAAARSIELPNAESAACARVWPLLAVADDQLSPLDRGARDGHIAACARCRRIALDTWLDADPALAPRVTLPTAVARPELAKPRRSRFRFALAAGSLAAAAIGAVAFEVAHLTSRPGVDTASHVESRPRAEASTSKTRAKGDPIAAVLARLKDGVPPAVVRDQLREFKPTDALYPYALYWVAVVSLRDMNDWEGARAALAELAPIHIASRWLGPWTLIRNAQLAEHDGRTADARELWLKAKAESYRDDEYVAFLDAATKRLGL